MDTKKVEWFENEEDWIIKRPIIFSRDFTSVAFIEIARLIKLLGKTRPGIDVLDLCCGVGRHSLELARNGFNVTGVDITQHYLNIAAEQAEKENLTIGFIRSDMRYYRNPEAYDLVTNLCTSFGYFDDINDDIQVLANIYDSLKPGGRFVIEVLGKEIIAAKFMETENYVFEGLEVIAKSRILNDWGTLECKRLVMKNGVDTEVTAYHRLYSATELKGRLADVGFRNCKVYGSFSGTPYDNQAKTMVIVSEK
jgi:SAM-dependent methyltransferase